MAPFTGTGCDVEMRGSEVLKDDIYAKSDVTILIGVAILEECTCLCYIVSHYEQGICFAYRLLEL